MAERQDHHRIRSIMPMKPPSFGTIEEQTLDFGLPFICHDNRRLTTDSRTRRLPDFAVHELDGAPRRQEGIVRLAG